MEAIFENYSSLKNFFDKQADSDIWKECYISEVKAKALPNAPILKDVFKDEYNIENEDAMEQAMYETGLVLNIPLEKGENFPVSILAVNSLIARAGVGKGPLFKIISSEDMARFLNLAYQSFDNTGLVLIRNDMVAAFHSDNYQVFPVNKIIDIAENNLPPHIFKSGYYSEEVTYVDFELNNSKYLDEYNKELIRFGSTPLKGKLLIRVMTSDIAVSAVKIIPFIYRNDGVSVQIGQPFSINHTTSSSENDIVESCQNCFQLFEEAKKKAIELSGVNINHPTGCFLSLSKDLALPKKYALEAVELFVSCLNDDTCNAYDIYSGLWDIISLMYADKVPALRIISVMESISRALSKEIKNYDHDFMWS